MKHTLKELKEMRAEWIEGGHERGRFEAARLIGEHFAELSPRDSGMAFPRFPKAADLGGGIIVHYKIIEQFSGSLVAATLKQSELVAVTVGGIKGKEYISGKRVLFWTFGDLNSYVHLHLFIPGKWEKILNGALSLAEEAESKGHGKINKAKRDKLAKMLLIGQEV